MIRALVAIALATVLVVVLLVLRTRFIVVRVVGTSMEPTLHDGARVIVRRTTLNRVGQGQLVVFASPAPEVITASGDPPWRVKRVVALPGDAVPHDQVPELRDPAMPLVPAGHMVVLGDNKSASYDSRRAGYIDGSTLLGIVIRTLT